MGLLFHAPICSVCGEECDFPKYKLKDENWLCQDCRSDAGFGTLFDAASYDANDIKALIAKRAAIRDEINNFHPSKRVGDMLIINESRQRWYTLYGNGGKKNPVVYDFADIVSYELLEDGATITQGGRGSAAVGGALFGSVGAIVGSNTGKKKSSPVCTMLKIKITLRDLSNPVEYINFVSGEMKRSGFLFKQLYQAAQECTALLENMIALSAEPETPPQANVGNDAADEIMKYKNLLDVGAITQEEYNAKKAQLLGL
jgi:hypothetical protein